MNDLSHWFLLVVLLLLAACVRFAMLSRLKSLDPILWRGLGEPGPFNGNVRRHLLEASYLLRRQYLPLKDEKLTALSVLYSLCYIAVWSLFMFLVAQQWQH